MAERQGSRIWDSLCQAIWQKDALYLQSLGFTTEDLPAGKLEDAVRMDQALMIASAHTAAEAEEASARIFALTGDMTTMELFEPNELRQYAIYLSEEAVKLRLLLATSPDLESTDQADIKWVSYAVRCALDLMRSSMAIRKATYEHTKAILELADKTRGLDDLPVKARRIADERAARESWTTADADLMWSTWLRNHPQPGVVP